MPSWWTVVEGNGLQTCPQTLVKKLNGLSWITQAAWKSEPNGLHLALECVFQVAEAKKVAEANRLAKPSMVAEPKSVEERKMVAKPNVR